MHPLRAGQRRTRGRTPRSAGAAACPLRRLAAPLLATLVILPACVVTDDDGAAQPRGSPALPPPGPAEGDVDGTLVIGALVRTGEGRSPVDRGIAEAVEVAVAQVNESGGVLDGDARLEVVDPGPASADAAAGVAALLEAGADVVVGPSDARAAAAIAGRLASERVPQCYPAVTADDFDAVLDTGWAVRLAPPGRLEGLAVADALRRDGHRRPAVLAAGDPSARVLRDAVLERLGADLPGTAPPGTDDEPGAPGTGTGGVERVAADITVSSATEPGALEEQLSAAAPDSVVLLADRPTALAVLSGLAGRAGADLLPTYVTHVLRDAGAAATLAAASPTATQRVVGTAPAASPTGTAELVIEELEAAAPGSTGLFSAHAFDCATLLALAAVHAGTDAGDAVLAGLHETLRGEVRCTSFASCAVARAEGGDVDYDGASGVLDLVDGSPAVAAYQIWRYEDGGVVEADRLVEP